MPLECRLVSVLALIANTIGSIHLSQQNLHSIIDPATKYHIAHNETHLHSLAMDITKVQYAVESAIDALD
ncbi:hypothetical protein Q1695_000016 [Nippostrongylus brasiliensis]|nr:hypothetical protein Q1695_000016 [Nippostrongylus brasiliensis]